MVLGKVSSDLVLFLAGHLAFDDTTAVLVFDTFVRLFLTLSHRRLESLDGATKIGTDILQTLGTEDDQYDRKDDQ